jgi:hypothetical protein
MTRQRNDSHSTEFGIWLRKQRDISSSIGFIATNLDYMWQNYKTGEWMFLEEKRHNSKMTWSQSQQFEVIDAAVRNCIKYRGFHLIVFGNTSPDDGLIFIDDEEVSNKDLLEFLRFDKRKEWYISYFKKKNKKSSPNAATLREETA